MSETTAPLVHQQMLIRAPAETVFRAIQDPAIASRFWFSHGSAPLEPGRRVRWEWEMYGGGADVEVVAVEPGRRIVVDWSAHEGTRIDFRFEPRGEGATMVVIEVSGFRGSHACANAIDSSGGFAFVLAAMKALLEHGIELNVVPDKAPEAHVPDWRPR